MLVIRLFGKLACMLRDQHAGQLARGPDMNGLGQVERLVDRAALHAQGRPVRVSLMPDARAAARAKGAMDRVPAIGLARPALRRSLGDTEILAPDDQGDA